MTALARRQLSVAAVAACLASAGCGGEDAGDPIPQGKARAMEQRLDEVQAAVEDGRCEDVGPAVTRLQSAVAGLDANGVGDDVQDALAEGADNLRALASSDCTPEEDDQVETTPVPTTPAPETVPVPTTPEPEPEPEPEEEPLPDEETEPPPEETEPDEGGGEGQFDPSGGGTGPPGQLKKDGE